MHIRLVYIILLGSQPNPVLSYVRFFFENLIALLTSLF